MYRSLVWNPPWPGSILASVVHLNYPNPVIETFYDPNSNKWLVYTKRLQFDYLTSKHNSWTSRIDILN